MKLQKRLNRKVGNKEYSKYLIVIPPEEVEKMGWKEGEELQAVKKKDVLVLRAKR